MINKIFDKPSFSLFNNYEFIDKLRKKVNDIIDVINSGSSEDTGINYSTDEQKIGKWIDGSDLYQKSYNITIPESDETNLIGDDYLNIDNVTDIEVVLLMSGEGGTSGNTFIQGSIFGTNASGLSNTKIHAEFWSNGGLTIISGSDWTGTDAVLTIKYTKKG